MQREIKYPLAIKKRVAGDWNCSHCNNLNFSFRTHCNKCGNSKHSANPFSSSVYLFPPPLPEEYSENASSKPVIYNIKQLPMISSFLTYDSNVNSSFHLKSEEESSIKTCNDSNELEEERNDMLRKVKRPKTRRDGDWLCLKCKNLNFAFRSQCNVCKDEKKEFIEL